MAEVRDAGRGIAEGCELARGAVERGIDDGGVIIEGIEDEGD